MLDWILKSEDGSVLFINQIMEEIYTMNYDESKSEKFMLAKNVEIENWKKFSVYEEVDRKQFPGHDVMSCRWVTEEKQNAGETVCKARLVVRGFEELDAPISDSPTASKIVLRTCLVIANIFDLKLKALDIRAAFLQSETIQRVVLVKPPKEFRKNNEIVWKLNKPVYGLNDGARCWFMTVKKRLLEFGCTPLKLDNSVYVYQKEGRLKGFIVVHVDDFLVGGDCSFKASVVDKLTETFQIGSRKEGHFKYIGHIML